MACVSVSLASNKATSDNKIQWFCNDLLYLIVSYLDQKSLLEFQCASREFHDLYPIPFEIVISTCDQFTSLAMRIQNKFNCLCVKKFCVMNANIRFDNSCFLIFLEKFRHITHFSIERNDYYSDLADFLGDPWDTAGYPDISDSLIEYLVTIPTLTNITLFGCTSISDSAIQYLSQISGLVVLKLIACISITDRGLSHLSKLTKLTHLDFSFCSLVTNIGIDEIKLFVPRQDDLKETETEAENIINTGLLSDVDVNELLEGFHDIYNS